MRFVLFFMMLLLAGCMSMKTSDMTMVENASHQEIIEVANKSKQQLFEKSKQWIALSFKSAKNVIEYENIAEGKIIGNGTSTVVFNTESAMIGKMSYPIVIPFVMIEDIKEERARIVFKSDGIQLYAWEQLKPQFIQLTNSLRSYLISDGTDKSW